MIEYNSNSEESTKMVGESIGSLLSGGEVIECLSDLGGGKTTLVAGIAKGFGSQDPVSSPSFTICNTYKRVDKKQLQHFDFYRLSEPGIMRDELFEVVGNQDNVVVVEWGGSVSDVLPDDRIKIFLSSISDSQRLITIQIADSNLSKKLETKLSELVI